MSKNECYEVDGTTHFVPVQILSTYNNGCNIQVNTPSGPRDLIVDKVYSFRKTSEVVVPQFVAEWIEDFKQTNYTIPELLSSCMTDEVDKWYYENSEQFMRAWLNGYTIEQEKLYTVEIPNPNSTLNEFQVLALEKNGHGKIQITQFLPGYDWKNDGRCKLTESEIRKDFEWAWQAGFAKEVG